MPITETPLDPLFSTVTQIRYPDSADHGTGFFYKDEDECVYLITNQHVLRDPDSGTLESEIRYFLRANPDGTQVVTNDVELTEDSVLQHDDRDVDLAAILLDLDLERYANFAVSHQHLLDETGSELQIPCGKRALVIGYPIRGTPPYYPVARAVMIATPYGRMFEQSPYFLTDARMHDGMSGSPVVISRSEDTHSTTQGSQIATREISLIGIHSATQRDPIGPEAGSGSKAQLDLNITWYPGLLSSLLR